MNLTHPLELVSDPLDGRILEALAGVDAAMTPGQIARVARDFSERGIRAAADRLRQQGIVLAQPAGKATLYRLNREHLASQYVIGMAHIWYELVRRLRVAFQDWDPAPAAAYLFGSVARRDSTAQSDVDIFMVRPLGVDDDPAWADQRDRLALQVTNWTGNDIRILEYEEREAVALVAREAVLAAVRDEGIHLPGDAQLLASQGQS